MIRRGGLATEIGAGDLNVSVSNGIHIPKTYRREEIHKQAILGETVEGLELVQRMQDRPFFENSFTFIFPNMRYEDVVSRFKRSTSLRGPIVGAIAFYVAEGRIVHVGKVIEDGNIISKWGAGNVYKHRPDLVPARYGDLIAYVDLWESPVRRPRI